MYERLEQGYLNFKTRVVCLGSETRRQILKSGREAWFFS